MSKNLERKSNSVIYGRIQKTRMSDADRLTALNALANADAIVTAVVWVAKKIEHLNKRLFLKPSLKY